MWEILKFVAMAFLILVLLAAVVPLLWLVIQMSGWFFGDAFIGFATGNLIWISIIVISIITIIVMASK